MSADIIYPGEFQKPVRVEFKNPDKRPFYDLVEDQNKKELSIILMDYKTEPYGDVEELIEMTDDYIERIEDVYR